MALASPSTPTMPRSVQLAQDTRPLPDRRVSRNSSRPISARAGSCFRVSGIGWIGSSSKAAVAVRDAQTTMTITSFNVRDVVVGRVMALFCYFYRFLVQYHQITVIDRVVKLFPEL